MEKLSSVWTKVVCFGFMLLKIELTNGAVNILTTGKPYIGSSFKLECHITPFIGTANWAKDGTTQTTCGTTFCAPVTLGNYTFAYDGTGISVTIHPVSTSDGGFWQCTHTSGLDNITLTPTVQSECSTSTLTTSTNTSALKTGSTTYTSVSSSTCTQLQSSKECCYIVYVLPFKKWVCILFYVLLSLVCMVLFIIMIRITYVYYWRRQKANNKDKSGSDLSPNRRGKSDTWSISNLDSIPLPYRSDVGHKRLQNEVNDLKDKTGRHHENTGLNKNDHTLQENGTTYI